MRFVAWLGALAAFLFGGVTALAAIDDRYPPLTFLVLFLTVFGTIITAAGSIFELSRIGVRKPKVVISRPRRLGTRIGATGPEELKWDAYSDAERERRRRVIRDRDNSYGADFGSKLASAGIEDIRTSNRAPLANSVAERVVRTFRQECLDHGNVLNERHLVALLSEFVGYYNYDRPHRTLELEAPVPCPLMSGAVVVSRAILGGLHHAYGRAA